MNVIDDLISEKIVGIKTVCPIEVIIAFANVFCVGNEEIPKHKIAELYNNTDCDAFLYEVENREYQFIDFLVFGNRVQLIFVDQMVDFTNFENEHGEGLGWEVMRFVLNKKYAK